MIPLETPKKEVFVPGSLIKWEHSTHSWRYGVVLGPTDDGIILDACRRDGRQAFMVRWFDEGLPLDYSVHEMRSGPYFAKPELPEFLDHLRSVADGFNRSVHDGGLKGAIDARRQQSVRSLIDRVTEARHSLRPSLEPSRSRGELHYHFGTHPISRELQTHAPEPGTGVYVVQGTCDERTCGQQMEGVVAEPRVPEETLGQLLKVLHPQGLGEISNHVPSVQRFGYKAFEIPEEHTDLVPKPIVKIVSESKSQ